MLALLLLLVFAVCTPGLAQASPDPQRALVTLECLWDRAEHQAFTDICRFGDRLYVAFREGESHVYGRDGVVRILSSADGFVWRSAAVIEEEGVDLRDPKLSVSPDGRLMVVMGGSVYDGRRLMSRRPKVSFSDAQGRRFSASTNVTIDPAIAGSDDWLWRVTWRGDRGYGVVYQVGDEEWATHLVSTEDGLRYRHVSTFELDGQPNETTLRFQRDGTMLALVRREAGDRRAAIGRAEAPYTEWSWSYLPEALGGPNFVVLADGSLLAAGREYADDATRTVIASMGSDGAWKPLLRLPSGRDTSYPGMLVEGDRLWFSYYSGHEGKTSIYLARLRLPSLLAR